MKAKRGRRSSPARPNGFSRKQQTAPSKGRREALILAAIGIPVLVLTAIAAVMFAGQPSAPAATKPPPIAGNSRLVYPDSPSLGPVDAPVTLVEFLDPECEACRAAYPIVKNVMDDYDGQVRLVVRYVPGHGNSALAAAAIEEAGRQGRYWETLEYFFERQPEWGEQQVAQVDAFLQYGADLGLDTTALGAALASPDLTKVERDGADARAVGIRGTPTFFVNGQMVEQTSEQALRAAIDEALQQ